MAICINCACKSAKKTLPFGKFYCIACEHLANAERNSKFGRKVPDRSLRWAHDNLQNPKALQIIFLNEPFTQKELRLILVIERRQILRNTHRGANQLGAEFESEPFTELDLEMISNAEEHHMSRENP